MGAIEDLRKVVQDLVTPDFRALEARVSSLEAKLDLTGESLNDKIDSTAKGLNEKIDIAAEDLRERLAVTATKSDLTLTREVIVAELQSLQTFVNFRIDRLTASLDIDDRLAKIYQQRAQEQMRRLEKTA